MDGVYSVRRLLYLCVYHAIPSTNHLFCPCFYVSCAAVYMLSLTGKDVFPGNMARPLHLAVHFGDAVSKAWMGYLHCSIGGKRIHAKF